MPIAEPLAAFDPEEGEKAKMHVPGHDVDELKTYFETLRDFYRAAERKG